jgi:UDP-N-acetylglucosamine 4,6-dehydratase
MDRFESIGVIRNEPVFDAERFSIASFARIAELKAAGRWDKPDLVALFHAMIPDFRPP